MKRKQFPKIIFFINGPMPTEEQEAEAFECGFNVVFRNALLVSNSGNREECDGVAGEVPERYSDKPTAEEALRIFAQSFRRGTDAADDGLSGDGLSDAIKRGLALVEDAGKGKGKPEAEKPADWEISKPAAPVPPAAAPAWTPNT